MSSNTSNYAYRTIESPVGSLTLVASATALRAVMWADDEPRRAGLDDAALDDAALDDAAFHDAAPRLEASEAHRDVLDQAQAQLDQYFAGTRHCFDLPLNAEGTEFQQAAWRGLIEIPYGETRTYGQQATAIGRPTAVRAIGAANGRNPLSIVVPCHRVIGADGSLTGFAGGVDKKRLLLDHEATHRADSPGAIASPRLF